MIQSDLSSQDLTTCRLRLSDELIFTLQKHGGTTYCHVEAPSKGQFYRLGYSEYVLLSLLDGNTTLAQAITLSARALGAQALSQARATEVATWLLNNELAFLAASGEHPHRELWPATTASSQRWRQLNPFWLKVPLLRPDPSLQSLQPVLGWLFSPLLTLLGVLLIATGISVIATNWDRFLDSSHLIFSPHNWLSMLAAWMALKMLHELGHALVCKRYGGEVREAGLVLILFAPAAYVDVTSCWRFPSKWQRIHVALAGMYVELVVAALAAIIWTQTTSVVLQHQLFNIILMASFSTMVFNANPLMRFDGYYILADLLEIPNLATEGHRFMRRLAAGLFLGQGRSDCQLEGFRSWLVRIYGLAAAMWRVVVCGSLFAAASVLLHGLGMVLGIFGVVAWLGQPAWQAMRELHRQYYEAPLLAVRALIVAVAVLGTVYLGCVYLPWPATITAPAVVQYTDLSIVRSRVDGFVQRIHVQDGQPVTAGQLLLELRNDPLSTEMRELESAVAQADLLHRAALNQHDAAEVQVALRNRQAHAERLAEIRDQLAALMVYAPIDGRIVARNLDGTLGTYVQEGDELLAVGDEQEKELLLSISQQDIDQVTTKLGTTIPFRTGDLNRYHGKLTTLEPRASRRLPHPAISAAMGGPLAVERPDRDTSNSERDASNMAMRLIEPRVTGVMTLSPETSLRLACGDRGYAVLARSNQNIAQHIRTSFRHWLDQLDKLRRQQTAQRLPSLQSDLGTQVKWRPEEGRPTAWIASSPGVRTCFQVPRPRVRLCYLCPRTITGKASATPERLVPQFQHTVAGM